MRARFHVSLVALVAAVAAAGLILPGSVSGQDAGRAAPEATACPGDTPAEVRPCALEHAKSFQPPRTPDGKPDLSGYWGGSQRAHEDLEEHPKTPDDAGGPSTVVDPPDGKVPIQPWAEEQRKENRARYIDQNAQCFQSGVPRHLYMGAYQFFQTPTHFVLFSEETNAYRNVILDGRPHVGKRILLWQGDSRGHWDGNTLVVETRNQNGLPRLDQRGRFYTDEAVVVERFTLFEPNSMLHEATITDLLVYRRPFTIANVLRRNQRPGYEIWEEACYEGESNSAHLRAIGYRNYPGISSAQARKLREAYERRQGK